MTHLKTFPSVTAVVFVCLCSCNLSSSNNDIADHEVAMDSIGAVSWLGRAGNAYFLEGKDSAFYVYVKVRGNEVAKKTKRVPLNISLVMDRSGSMMGDKIAYAKKAAAFVVQQLSGDDMVSVVNYDNEIEVTSPSQPVKNKELLLQKINELFDRGGTNLTGGMLAGYEQAKSTRKDGYVNRVLLLTDGLANIGITDPGEIRRLVQTKYAQDGIALSTFGLGADYNEDLLTQLAETGHANYYFIDEADKIPNIFDNELKGLLSVVAQNASVQLSFPASLEVLKVYGYPFETKENSVIIRFNDLYAKDEKGILIKLRSKSPATQKILLQCHLSYTDAGNFETVSNDKQLAIQASRDTSAINKHKDALVEEMIALYEATEVFDEIMSDVDHGNYDGARVKADSMVLYLKTKQQYIRSGKLKKQEEKISTYNQDIEKVKTMQREQKSIYQKSNKSENYLIKKGKH